MQNLKHNVLHTMWMLQVSSNYIYSNQEEHASKCIVLQMSTKWFNGDPHNHIFMSTDVNVVTNTDHLDFCTAEQNQFELQDRWGCHTWWHTCPNTPDTSDQWQASVCAHVLRIPRRGGVFTQQGSWGVKLTPAESCVCLCVRLCVGLPWSVCACVVHVSVQGGEC